MRGTAELPDLFAACTTQFAELIRPPCSADPVAARVYTTLIRAGVATAENAPSAQQAIRILERPSARPRSMPRSCVTRSSTLAVGVVRW